MKLCLNDTNDRCISKNNCVCATEYLTDQRNALTLPLVSAILHCNLPLRYIYICILIFIASMGLISNVLSLLTFLRDRIRYTLSGVYLTIFALCNIVLMGLFLTNIIIALRYDHYWIRLWACHGYPYLFLVMINTSILMTVMLAVENVLSRYFGFDRFRSRKSALFISLNIFILTMIFDLDKLFARHLILDQSGHLYCTYKDHPYRLWFYMNRSTVYFCVMVTSLIHMMCIIFILSKIKQQKQKTYRKISLHGDILWPSLVILLCSCPYIVFYHVSDTSIVHLDRLHIRLHIAILFILCIPQILTFVIYVLFNYYHLREFQRSWLFRILCCFCCDRWCEKQEFQVIHRLWQRPTALETVMTISSLQEDSIDTELYNRIKLEV